MSDESAFPVWNGPGRFSGRGMTLRDYFAAKALSSISGPAWAGVGSRLLEPHLADETAQEAYAIADAMLKAREVK